jgi:hypothetical protein
MWGVFDHEKYILRKERRKSFLLHDQLAIYFVYHTAITYRTVKST